MSLVSEFLERVRTLHATGAATEHTYRPAIEALLDSLDPSVAALNEPKRVSCGAPDFIVQRGEIIVGHVEAKDVGVSLRGLKGPNGSQQSRYRQALPNLVYTNCLDWDFYRDGELMASAAIARYQGEIQPIPDAWETLENLLRDFISRRPQTISSPRVLAGMMAGKAMLIRDVLCNALKADEGLETELSSQFLAFGEHLIHDISPEDFADLYAETIAYGMFAARLHDTTLDTFSRQEALTLLPRSNPFLRSLFGYIAGVDLDQRIAWIIDDLAAVFQAANMRKIMEGFGRLTGKNDPFLHFYETFLAAYNPKKRKARGVWYTPEPVVSFIVRAVDGVLRREFGLPDGLADTSKITIHWETGQTDRAGRAVTLTKAVHRVQILDPATGTGTFLAEVIKEIAPRVRGVAPGMWSQYIEQDLIPRLHGFELLMASYAMCHMKLDMILNELDYRPSSSPPRLSVYLTNSLEEGGSANQTLPFTQWLSREAKGANAIKRDMPIMCIIGNPPYLGQGGVSGGWLGDLMDDYKLEPGGQQRLQERNPKWLNDLYVKFIRWSCHLIEKNGEGVVGFITNNGYLDNPTFRGMRWHLLRSFDRIWVLDLHGNAKKKETAPDGKADKNVFDIQQGVAILIAVRKKGGCKGLAEVMHGDLWGTRTWKYDALTEGDLGGAVFAPLRCMPPQYPLVRRDLEAEQAYAAGFSVAALMPVHSVGIVTARDGLTIDQDRERLWARVQDFASLEPEAARVKYRLGKDVRDWKVRWAQADVREHLTRDRLVPMAYRPFDTRWTFYTGRSRGFLCYPRDEVMRHLLQPNLALCTNGQSKDGYGALVVDSIGGHKVYGAYDINTYFPLYLYPAGDELDREQRINLDPVLLARLKGLARHPGLGEPDEVQVFDYLYGVLHCPAYLERYEGLLKTGFPRIPWPRTGEDFWAVSRQGAALRGIHLLVPGALGETPFPFMGHGDNRVDRPALREGRVHINETQYFDNAPEAAWALSIGGYQPAQKWLKDRRGHVLCFDDVKHYQRILKALSETDRIMRSITLAL